jgi:polyisoprenoid-binding protein YceI
VRLPRAGLALLWWTCLVSPLAAMQTPVPGGVVREGTLSFDGRATLGDFVGTTSTVTGQLEGAESLAGVHGWVEAPVKTLVTGNGKRDRDLNKSMESEQYPVLRFELASLEPGTGQQDSLPVTLHGRLIIHGVTREVQLPGVITLAADHGRIRSSFPLNLKDYRIGGLTKMLGMLKMHEDIVVHVDVDFGFTR